MYNDVISETHTAPRGQGNEKMKYQVIFKHINDLNERVVWETNSKQKAIKYVNGMKKEYLSNFIVNKWTNNGFCIPELLYVEIR